MTTVDTNAAADGVPAATREAFSFMQLEERLATVRNGPRALIEMETGDGFRDGPSEVVRWIASIIGDAERATEVKFGAMLADQRRQEALEVAARQALNVATVAA